MSRTAAWIGLRYLRARPGSPFVSFISGIAMTGIALGVFTLVVVLSVMNGFERDLGQRILDVVSHATLEGDAGRLEAWREIAASTGDDAGVVAVAPFVEGRGMVVAGERSAAIDLRAVLPEEERRVSALERHLTGRGFDELVPGEWRILLGRGLADKLSVAIGDPVLVVIAQGNVTPAGVMPRMRRFTVAGLVDAGMYEFDQGLGLVHLDDARRLFRLGDAVTGLRYAFDDPATAARRIRAIAEGLEGRYYISDWSRRQGNFFRSLQVTKSIMFFVLLLVVGVAAFNIISTLVMVVKEKRADIAILRTLGGSPREMLAIFMTQGSIIGLLGTVVGVGLGRAAVRDPHGRRGADRLRRARARDARDALSRLARRQDTARRITAPRGLTRRHEPTSRTRLRGPGEGVPSGTGPGMRAAGRGCRNPAR
jgi:lipoprotein-releasing system permease protein